MKGGGWFGLYEGIEDNDVTYIRSDDVTVAQSPRVWHAEFEKHCTYLVSSLACFRNILMNAIGVITVSLLLDTTIRDLELNRLSMYRS